MRLNRLQLISFCVLQNLNNRVKRVRLMEDSPMYRKSDHTVKLLTRVHVLRAKEENTSVVSIMWTKIRYGTGVWLPNHSVSLIQKIPENEDKNSTSMKTVSVRPRRLNESTINSKTENQQYVTSVLNHSRTEP